MKAKDFSLPDQDGVIHKLSDYKGKWIVLYFYPKDDTPGCTKEACGFREISQEFKNKNAVVLGVSKDSIESHKKFSDKYHLNFPILSDVDKKVIQEYGAWGEKKFLGKTFQGTLRNTYLIDPQGQVKKKFEKVNPLTHPQEILKAI
ncbi:thioredoxin-dependent thiol peroxidase [Patescibacteria group bacterium]|nr:thioredoxin-dependent thiol peroxidase [Patescibacteria group bacterium]